MLFWLELMLQYYISIPHNVGLKVLREELGKRQQERIPTAELAKIAGFF